MDSLPSQPLRGKRLRGRHSAGPSAAAAGTERTWTHPPQRSGNGKRGPSKATGLALGMGGWGGQGRARGREGRSPPELAKPHPPLKEC